MTTSSIERVYRNEGERLWWALLAYTGDREVSSDAVAEAFARALASVDSIREPSPWIWRVAFRVATAQLRADRREHELRLDTFDGVDGTAAEVILAIRRLPERQRAVIALYYLDDRSPREIASLLGIATATVSVHLHGARARLRSILEAEDA